MFRTDLLEITGFYPYGFNHAEDYALFWRLIRASQSAVLSEFLVTCELNEKGISHGNRPRQLLSRIKVVYRYGSNPFLVFLGILRTAILLLIPYRLLLKLKTLKRPWHACLFWNLWNWKWRKTIVCVRRPRFLIDKHYKFSQLLHTIKSRFEIIVEYLCPDAIRRPARLTQVIPEQLPLVNL